jgi:hypothetical protein
MFVLIKNPEVKVTNAEDIKLITKADIPSFLCILISDQKRIKEKMKIIGREYHITTPSLITTLLKKKNVAIHIKSNIALV